MKYVPEYINMYLKYVDKKKINDLGESSGGLEIPEENRKAPIVFIMSHKDLLLWSLPCPMN